MRQSIIRIAVGFALVISTLNGPTDARAASPGFEPDQGLLAQLQTDRLSRHVATGAIRFVGGTVEAPIASARQLGLPGTSEQAARQFVNQFGRLFGVTNPSRDLRLERRIPAADGRWFARFRQTIEGVPVLGGELTVQVDSHQNVLSANGELLPNATVDPRPTITPAEARGHALDAVSRALEAPRARLSATTPSLAILDPKLLGGPNLPITRLVYETEVSGGTSGEIREYVLIDAQSGAVALRFSKLAHAKNRIVCNAVDRTRYVPCTTADPNGRTEGEPPTLSGELNATYDYMGDTYDLFFDRFGRDGLDGAGSAMRGTVNYCSPSACPYLNAFWNGSQIVFGRGFGRADDVVGHELAHGFTEYTSGLFYYYQSGAINESLSDIFGEFVDLTNGAGTDTPAVRWLMGEDLDPPGTVMDGALRNMKDPTAMGDPDRMTSPLYFADPGELDAGGVHFNSGVGNKTAYLMTDGGTFNGRTITGIGIDKSVAVWYEAAATMISSATDYADLFDILYQACLNRVSGSEGITSSDCAQVREATLATELNLQPVVPGAAATHAPTCTAGTPSSVFFDDLENPASGNWTTAGASNVWFYPQNPNAYGVDMKYATSGTTNFWGDDPGRRVNSAIRMTAGVAIPANAFLHFNHAYGFDDAEGPDGSPIIYDGGLLRYRVVGGSSWNDVPADWFTHNGYDGVIQSQFNNPLGGRPGFGGESAGYISSRVDLSALAGQTVRFEFRIGTDSIVADYGWFIDDISIHTCPSDGDTTPPSHGAPQIRFPGSGTIDPANPQVPVRVTLGATDPSGVTSVTLQHERGAKPFADVTLPAANPETVSVRLQPGGSAVQRFRMRAKDEAGNQSAFAAGVPFTLRAYQDQNPNIAYVKNWSIGNVASFYGGRLKYASTAKHRASLTTAASDFAIVSTKNKNRGKVRVIIRENEVIVVDKTVDLYNPTVQRRQIVFSAHFDDVATRRIEYRLLGTKNPASSGTRVDLDAILTVGP